MKKANKVQDFFATHPVFRLEEFDAFKARGGSTNPGTRDAHLAHYVKKTGRLLRVRRGLYAVVPSGRDTATFQPDPYLLCSRLAPDAVLAYHSALQYHGFAHSLWSTHSFLSSLGHVDFSHAGVRYRSVRPPGRLKDAGLEVETVEHQGLELRVTSLERTLVDCLDRSAWGGEAEEVWHSYQSVEYLNADKVTDYALALDKAATAAKTGLFLEKNRRRWKVDDSALNRLEEAARGATRYWNRRTGVGRSHLAPRWGLMVSDGVLGRYRGEDT